jgi:STE24 endopeptidase
MQPFSLVFLAALGLASGAQWWLARRQIAHVQRCRTDVPSPFRGMVSAQAHARAADYAVARARTALLEIALTSLLLGGRTLGGGLEGLDRLWRSLGAGPLAIGCAVILSVLGLSMVLELPLSAYRTFVVEQRFGFNRTTAAVFWADSAKELLLTGLLALPLSGAVLWLMGAAGRYWWVYAWGTWMAFAMLMLWAFPPVIEPLFNRFTLGLLRHASAGTPADRPSTA